jgi:hypothetical protein
MAHKKPLDPLIPLDELKKIVAGIARVPKPDEKRKTTTAASTPPKASRKKP